MIILIVVIIFLFVITIWVCAIKNKISDFLMKYFGTSDLSKAIEISEIENSEIPKSISSMEPLLIDRIKNDFPDLNINELKSMAENAILDCFKAVECKKIDKKFDTDKVNSWVTSYINDVKDKNVHFDSIKFHRSAISRYEKKDGIVSMYINSSLEYYYGENGKRTKKIQDRFRLEFIYIIDSSKVILGKKGLGLNCPNCGAIIKSLGHKTCDYCGSYVKDIVKRTWYLNNIERF